MKTKKSFAQTFLIISTIVLITGVTLLVLWKSYVVMAPTGQNNPHSVPKEVTYKEHTSITGSGLSFTYPDSWTLSASDTVTEGENGDKFASILLFSQEPSKNSNRIEVPTDHICVTLSEFSGEWPRSYGPQNSEVPDLEFTIGGNRAGLVTHYDTSSGYFNGKLVSIDPYERGASYVPLKNGYFLKATAQKNCYPSDDLEKRDVAIDIEQSRAILKSVRLAE